ncbi:DnaJ-domain-containing protein [Annulohypoxylon nitens]|nr:DnaJ-domain-containing protein [Annulohypoxylon nitens]
MLHTTNRKRKDRFDFYQQFFIDQNIFTEPPKMRRPQFPKHDLYNVLGVSSDATLDEIKKAYRELCKKVHPDKAEGGNNTENNERFQKVQEAWEILRDEVLRKEYDQWRASGAKDGDRHEDRHESSNRRRRERRGQKEQSGRPGRDSARPKASQNGRSYSYPDDTYEPKPNRNRKPYYEEWSESNHRDGSKSYGPGPGSGSWHYGAPPYGSGGAPPPPPPPPRYDSWGPGYRPQSSGGPQQVRLEDRIIAMRIRVDLNQVSYELDNLYAEFAAFKDGFMSRFNPPEAEKNHWKVMFEEASDALAWMDEGYDSIHFRLEKVESGYPGPTADLPERLGKVQAHVTRMKYSLSAALIILGQMSEYMPYDAEQQLLKMLESRLYVFAWPEWTDTGGPK